TGRYHLHGQLVHIEIALERRIDVVAVAGLLGRVEDNDIKPLAVGNGVAEPGEQVCLEKADARLVQVGVLFGEFDCFLVEVEANDFRGPAKRLGIDGESSRVTAEVEYAPAGAEVGERPAVVALVEKEAGLVLGSGRDAEPDAVLRYCHRRRRLRRATIER